MSAVHFSCRISKGLSERKQVSNDVREVPNRAELTGCRSSRAAECPLTRRTVHRMRGRTNGPTWEIDNPAVDWLVMIWKMMWAVAKCKGKKQDEWRGLIGVHKVSR